MNLITNLCFMILTTTVTGAILTGCWYFIAKILERAGKPEYILTVFQVIQLFFLVPVSMLFFVCFKYRNSFYFRYVLRISRKMAVVSYVAVIFWGIGVLWQIVVQFKKFRKQYRFSKTLFSCEVGKEKVFSEVCSGFSIKKGRVALCQSYVTQTPFLMGIIRPKVVLPVRKYSEQQLKVIFTHELNHYRQKDLWIKMLNSVVQCIHFFNPCVKVLKTWISLWSEFACDCRSVKELGYTKEYFATITDMMSTGTSTDMLVSGLYELEEDLGWRVAHMIKYNKSKKFSAVKAFAMGVATVTLSGLLILRTTVFAADMTVNAYYQTENEAEETAVVDGDVEYTDTRNMNNPAEILEVNPFTRDATSYSVTVPAHSYVMTKSVRVPAGSTISITGITSSTTLPLRAGIGNSVGDVRYINAYGAFSHNFAVDYASSYYVYFENNNDVDIEVTGSYQFCSSNSIIPE